MDFSRLPPGEAALRGQNAPVGWLRNRKSPERMLVTNVRRRGKMFSARHSVALIENLRGAASDRSAAA